MAEDSGSSKGKGVCSSAAEASHSWPVKIRLSTDHMRWNSLKMSPSKELQEQILGKMRETSRKQLDAWIPVEMFIYDVDTCETYKVKLAKKESFWFEPAPFLDEKEDPYPSSSSKRVLKEQPCSDLKKARKEFAYTIEPFRHIVKKRNLSYGHEIGLRWSGSKSIDKLEFSVLYVPRRLDLQSLRI